MLPRPTETWDTWLTEVYLISYQSTCWAPGSVAGSSQFFPLSRTQGEKEKRRSGCEGEMNEKEIMEEEIVEEESSQTNKS